MRLTFGGAMMMLTCLLAAAAPGTLLAQIVHESPFYCDLSMLSAAEREHKDAIGGHLAAARLGIRELPDGYEFQFPGDTATLQQLNDWLATERLCCPFFTFDLHMASEHGPIALRLTGPKGVKAFIKADFGRWLK
jgi:hypothetical protein